LLALASEVFAEDPSTKPPPPDVIAERRERFERLNEEARVYGAWLVSVPGAKTVIAETLEDSPWPDVLRRRFELEELEQGERIIPCAIATQFVQNADGTLAPLVVGSTRPVTTTFAAAGIAKTRRFSFTLP
jgi:hypothetical protein